MALFFSPLLLREKKNDRIALERRYFDGKEIFPLLGTLAKSDLQELKRRFSARIFPPFLFLLIKWLLRVDTFLYLIVVAG